MKFFIDLLFLFGVTTGVMCANEVTRREDRDNNNRRAADPNIPASCKKIGICENIPGYPDALAQKLVKELQGKGVRFNNDVLPHGSRRKNEHEKVELCETDQKVFAPRAGQDQHNKWHIVINPEQAPVQKYRVEICKTSEKSCSQLAFFQNGYHGLCEQKFILRPMYTIDNGKNVETLIQVPSCCICTAYRS